MKNSQIELFSNLVTQLNFLEELLSQIESLESSDDYPTNMIVIDAFG